MFRKIIIVELIIIVLLSVLVGFLYFDQPVKLQTAVLMQSSQPQPTPMPENTAVPTPTQPVLKTPPQSKILPGGTHVFQTFNNCGPASLSMALSYYGISKTQKELGDDLRPYQNSQGINDDKSVTLEELGEKAKEYDLIPFHRPGGNPEIIKYFITYDLPIIARTWTQPQEDIGHYRVIKGYDEDTQEIIQDDSLQNKNLRFSYSEFDLLWEKFNFEYLVLVPKDKVEIAKSILGENANLLKSWENAAEQARKKLEINPSDANMRFNLSVAIYNIGDYQGAIEEYEKVEDQLPFRALWYQIEPILAYQKVGNYDKVFQISNRILKNGNKAFSELYILRGQIYAQQGKRQEAVEELQKAVFYNQNSMLAQQALDNIEVSDD